MSPAQTEHPEVAAFEGPLGASLGPCCKRVLSDIEVAKGRRAEFVGCFETLVLAS